jgi:hypothetical protein
LINQKPILGIEIGTFVLVQKMERRHATFIIRYSLFKSIIVHNGRLRTMVELTPETLSSVYATISLPVSMEKRKRLTIRPTLPQYLNQK